MVNDHESYRRRWVTICAGVALFALSIGGMAACVPAGKLPPRMMPDSAPLNEFAMSCEKGIDNWTPAQVDYPKTMTLTADTPGIYVAAVDVRDVPLPPEQLIPAKRPGRAAIAVKCVMSARLVAEKSMSVDEPEWITRRFNAVGILNWSWYVTGESAGLRQLKLELQPAVVANGYQPMILPGSSPEQTLAFVTEVKVTAGPPSVQTKSPGQTRPPTQTQPRPFGQWLVDSWQAIAVGVGAVAGAVLAAIRWADELGAALRSLRNTWRRPKQTMTDQDETDSAPEPPRSTSS